MIDGQMVAELLRDVLETAIREELARKKPFDFMKTQGQPNNEAKLFRGFTDEDT